MKKITYFFTISLLIAGYSYSSDQEIEKVELRYPVQSATFYKSQSLVAVSQRQDSPQVGFASLLGPRAENFTESQGILGFQVLRYKDHEPLSVAMNDIKAHLDSSQGSISPVYHSSSNDPTPFIPTGRIHLKFKRGTPPEACTDILAKHNLDVSSIINELEIYGRTSFNTQNSVDIASSIQRENEDHVDVALPEWATPVAKKFPPRDALFKDQWHLENTGFHRGTRIGLLKGADARVAQAWQTLGNYGSDNVTIAVIDDGFDLGHPDLGGTDREKIVSPWDFTRNNDLPVPGNGDWHGTCTAGVATGIEGGGDIIGVAPNAKLMPIRWGTGLTDQTIEDWFYWAKTHNADVISCSWGAAAKYFPLSQHQSDVITDSATQGRGGKGCVIVFAAGNDNHDINDPASGTLDGFAIHPHVISVAASTSVDTKAPYSNFGKEISVCAPSSGAPGMGVLTSDVRDIPGYVPGDYYSNFGGTSSACPVVSGVSALVLGVNPNLSSSDVKSIIERTARKIGNTYDAQGHSIYHGNGCVDANAAVIEARSSLSS